MPTRQRVVQVAIVAVVEVVTLLLLPLFIGGLTVTSWQAALGAALAFTVAQVVFWWVFIRFFAWLPAWLYPVLTFALTGAAVMLFGNLIPGITIANVGTGIWITVILTAVNAILASLLSLDVDEQFDRNVTRQLVARRGNPITTDAPGFVYLEIDGLGEALFRRALAEGHLPTLKRWLDAGTHTITGWETDFSAQTGAMQPGILQGNNDEIPAFRWWDRAERTLIMSSNPKAAKANQARLSDGRGLLAPGGTSRGNMFSGDAAESTMTFSTILDRAQARGPGIYVYLFSPYVIARLITRFLAEVVKEWSEQIGHRLRKSHYKYTVSARNWSYGFVRAGLGSLLQDLTTYQVIGDILRGVPAIYALYPGYDDIGHFIGMQTPEAFEMLAETDRYFARVEAALAYAPRPYHLIVLSDHGQSEGPTFKDAHGLSLEDLVKGLMAGDQAVLALSDPTEGWDHINAMLSESVNADTRMAGLLRTALKSKTADGLVDAAPADAEQAAEQQASAAQVIVLGSGCTGLVYFTDAPERLTYEAIQARYPELILGLVRHPGVGFVMVTSAADGAVVLGVNGVHFLDRDTVEGDVDPLAVYGPNAARHLRRESSFVSCPDLVVNSRLDPATGELCGFENQVSHHGGLGGPQNHAFIFHPTALPAPSEPVVWATGVYRVLRGWRDGVAAGGSGDAGPGGVA